MAVPRSGTLLSALLALLLVATGTAFGLTFDAQLDWHQRDSVNAAVTDLSLSGTDEGHRVVADLRVGNPLDRPIELTTVRLLVFEGDPPPETGDRLSVPRTATVERVTLGAGETRTLRVEADVHDDDVDRTRRALAAGDASSRGQLTARMAGEEFDIRVE
ncbi:hypothetical protein [Halorarum salinum]|uniref:Late embryogenesis abundant protein LEA-2 subgroup domain-containing protein n=1 Tax=Halorarum salinum TaxID=2743089 RepID=A0A7D5QHP7_9EURY|nr:hypothetical protein [Halobaculum salinum]QLG62922.1 hypothetical protein HUG12_14760 [Halobaculum salinum]